MKKYVLEFNKSSKRYGFTTVLGWCEFTSGYPVVIEHKGHVYDTTLEYDGDDYYMVNHRRVKLVSLVGKAMVVRPS